VLMNRALFDLDADPLGKDALELMSVYKSRSAAEAAVKTTFAGREGGYAYYLDPNGIVLPTIISDTTAPALCNALRKTVAQERSDAKAAASLGWHLILFSLARFPIPKAVSAAPATKAGGAVAETGGAVKGAEAATGADVATASAGTK